jgi:hypothetical protein
MTALKSANHSRRMHIQMATGRLAVENRHHSFLEEKENDPLISPTLAPEKIKDPERMLLRCLPFFVFP